MFPIEKHRTIRKKLVIVGDGGCGKTSLLYAHGAKTFLEDHEPTVFESYSSTVNLNNKNVQLSLWDTAGQEDLDRLRPLSYSDADVLVVCFSVTDLESFINVAEKWVPEVRHYCPYVPIILVATKTDLRFDPVTTATLVEKGEDTLKTKDGHAMATRVNCTAYVECSAKTCDGVERVFNTAGLLSLKSRKRKQVSSCCMQ